LRADGVRLADERPGRLGDKPPLRAASSNQRHQQAHLSPAGFTDTAPKTPERSNLFSVLSELPEEAFIESVYGHPAHEKQILRTFRELHEFERRRRARTSEPLPEIFYMEDVRTAADFKETIYQFLEFDFATDISVPCPKVLFRPFSRDAFWDRISLSRLRFKGDKRSYVRVKHKPPDVGSQQHQLRPLLTLHVPQRGQQYDDMHAALQQSYRDCGFHFRGESERGGLRLKWERLLELGAPAGEVARLRAGYEVALHSEPPSFFGRNYG
jgi:hypothetical protein